MLNNSIEVDSNSNRSTNNSLTMIANQRMNTDLKQLHCRSGSGCSSPKPKRVHRANQHTMDKHKKRLRFSETSTLVVYPRGDEDVKESWLDKDKIAEIKQDIRKSTQVLRTSRSAKAIKHVAYAIATGAPEAEVHFHAVEHIRGVEHLLCPDVLKLLYQRRRLTMSRVLEEQAIQRRLGFDDPRRIAEVSMNTSSFTREWCRRVANLKES